MSARDPYQIAHAAPSAEPEWWKLAPPRCIGGPCRQGRAPCLTPRACRLIAYQAASPATRVSRRFVIRAMVLVVVVAGVFLYLGIR